MALARQEAISAEAAKGARLLLVHIVVVGVVASQRDERAQAQAVGEEDLSGRVQPHLRDSGRASASTRPHLAACGRQRREGGLPRSGPAC